ncbi:hypothetical protein [uncultured Erythrobacter sp.]|uniref:hypothetical protein n=1 Tax=uncultured Erythrobacter sp. TaxID=263913 RepID=UPI002626AFCF|nr:hypothetical protein [uncultured Erythrobacter sp.]
MDRKPHKLGLWLLGLASVATVAVAQDREQLREEAWLSESGKMEALVSEPATLDADLERQVEQLPDPAGMIGSADWKDQLQVGTSLFKTPFLFGGQAAKAGLSCHSCHVNGRDNPHFQFPGVSGQPGTADITHSFFSASLGNGTFDPVPIPDLAEAGKVDRSPQSAELEKFIRSIIVEEFAGEEPDEYVLASLATYTRAIGLVGKSMPQERVGRSIGRDLEVVDVMVGQARARLIDQPQDRQRLSRLLLAGARHRLALIHERLIEPDHANQREALERRSRTLGDVQNGLAEEGLAPSSASNLLHEWLRSFANKTELEALEGASLYDRDVLARHLEASE